MAATNGRTDVLSETGEVISSFVTQIESGETVSMEIRPTSEIGDLGLELRGVLAELEREIDKTTIQPFTITNDEEEQAAAEALIEDKREIAFVEGKLDKFANIAFSVHRTITGKRGEYASYAKARATIREDAIKIRAAEKLREKEAEDERLRQVARQEEEARVAAEAKELERRAKTEKRPDLAQRAAEIKAQPIREVAVSSRGGGAPISRKGSSGGSVGAKPGAYVIDVLDPEALILAAARPHIYREVIAMLTKELGKKKAPAIVEPLRAALEDFPNIPLSVLEPVEARIKDNAKANAGKINWPGVAVTADLKLTTRK